MNPDNYYGTASTLFEVSKMQKQPIFYVGPSRHTQELRGVSCRVLDDGTYQFLVRSPLGEEYILSGFALTRVNLRNDKNEFS
jgi:hypothetical protein